LREMLDRAFVTMDACGYGFRGARAALAPE
jgi:hypothetical protein